MALADMSGGNTPTSGVSRLRLRHLPSRLTADP
jgi:hypothetical protein